MYQLVLVHEFMCDYPGCDAEDGQAEPTKAAAWEHLARIGWRERRGRHYCPAHKRAVLS